MNDKENRERILGELINLLPSFMQADARDNFIDRPSEVGRCLGNTVAKMVEDREYAAVRMADELERQRPVIEYARVFARCHIGAGSRRFWSLLEAMDGPAAPVPGEGASSFQTTPEGLAEMNKMALESAYAQLRAAQDKAAAMAEHIARSCHACPLRRLTCGPVERAYSPYGCAKRILLHFVDPAAAEPEKGLETESPEETPGTEKEQHRASQTYLVHCLILECPWNKEGQCSGLEFRGSLQEEQKGATAHLYTPCGDT